MALINLPNGMQNGYSTLQNGISNGSLQSSFTNSLPRSDLSNGFRSAYTSPLPTFQDQKPGPTLVQLGEPIRLSVKPEDPPIPQPTPTLIPSTPNSTLDRKAVKFGSGSRRPRRQDPPKRVEPEPEPEEEYEEEESEEEPEPEPTPPPQRVRKVVKPKPQTVVPVVVVTDPAPKSIMKRTEVRQPKAPAIVTQVQEVEDEDDCLGCPKRTCVILWFVLFLLALAGLITMLTLYFLNICPTGQTAATFDSLECDPNKIKSVLTTMSRGADGNWPNAYPGTLGGNQYAPRSRFYFVDGTRDYLLPNSAPSENSLLVWHCGCEVEVIEQTLPVVGQQPVTEVKILGDRLKNRAAEILITVDKMRRYTMRMRGAVKCDLGGALLSVTPTLLNVNTGWNQNSVSSRTG